MEERPAPTLPRIDTDSNEYFPIMQVAALFPIGHQRLRELVRDGEIPASILPPAGKERPGRGRILIRPSEVKSWLRRQEVRVGAA